MRARRQGSRGASAGLLVVAALWLSACPKPAYLAKGPAVAPIPPSAGQVMAAEPGGSVPLTQVDGTVLALPDGARVTIEPGGELAVMTGRPVQIRSDIGIGTLPAARLLTEGRLIRTHDTRYVVFVAVTSCRMAPCRGEVWLLLGGGERILVTREAVEAVTVALHPHRSELAIGSRGLYIVSLGTLKVRPVHDFTAPAYAPDGALYVRGARPDDDSVYEYRPGEVAVFASVPGRPPDIGDAPADPSPVRFEHSGSVVVTDFVRAHVETVRKRRKVR